MKKARRVALISQKGGAGKTTVTMQLAAGMTARGLAVAVLDLDPQESALRWAESSLDKPFPATVVRAGQDAEAVRAQIAGFAGQGAMVLLDCPPSLEHPYSALALELADLALVPVVPSPPDLWSARAMERFILKHMATRKALAGALLPNRVQRTALSGSVLEVMQDFTLPVLDAPLTQRNAYAQSAVMGGSVYQMGKAAQAAKDEVERLVEAVLAQLR